MSLNSTGVNPTHSMKKVWVLEDDEGARTVYQNILNARYQVKLLGSIPELKEALKKDSPNLMICDLRLPGESFLNYLESGETEGLSGVPFIVVSSLDDSKALQTCFANGAIDYITKPFGKEELLVKTDLLLQRPTASGKSPYNVPQGLRVDSSTMRAYHGDVSSALLTAKEFQILSLMEQAPQNTVTRGEIVEKVWGKVKVGSKTLDVHIFNLRRKLNSIQVEISFTPPNQYRLVCK